MRNINHRIAVGGLTAGLLAGCAAPDQSPFQSMLTDLGLRHISGPINLESGQNCPDVPDRLERGAIVMSRLALADSELSNIFTPPEYVTIGDVVVLRAEDGQVEGFCGRNITPEEVGGEALRGVVNILMPAKSDCVDLAGPDDSYRDLGVNCFDNPLVFEEGNLYPSQLPIAD